MAAAGKAFFDMLGVFAEFETNLRRERQAEGIAAAKKRGIYKGRPAKIDRADIERRLIAGERPTEIARMLGISRSLVYQVKNQKYDGDMAPSKKFALLSMSRCDRIQKDMLKACQKVAEDHGLVIEAAGHNNADYGFYFLIIRYSLPRLC